jgi:REP element-mobilizing transposase RayT
MQLSDIGIIVAREWQKTPQIRPNIQLDEWVVMPNHLHGIIIINQLIETLRRNVSTNDNDDNPTTNNQPRLKPNSVGSIIGQFKSVCTKQIREMGFTEFRWQNRFHDHIIRDEESLSRIRQYIIHNPAKWQLDRNNSQNSQKLL